MPRRKAVRNNNGESTTVKQHKQAFNKWWKKYCNCKKIPHKVPKFVDEKGNTTDKANSLFV